ncbi:hypothetical protein [Mesonia mobilis]|uniref:hypothetical protein n=1 Tax=Mesonia mobilis TaxID=369791 RepID=UPI0026EE4BAE|nr:hypothetical protein [Mesonia mobilis]
MFGFTFVMAALTGLVIASHYQKKEEKNPEKYGGQNFIATWIITGIISLVVFNLIFGLIYQSF